MFYPYPPRRRAIGVEIEMVGIAPDQAHRVLLQQKLPALQRAYVQGALSDPPPGKSRFDYWQVMKDGSLKPEQDQDPLLCAEVATPIIQPSDCLKNLENVLINLQKSGATINDSCALQVHVDLRPEQKTARFEEAYWQIARVYAGFEPGLQLLVQAHRRANWMCESLRSLHGLILGSPALNHLPRHPIVQPKAGEYGSVEFRALQGTLEPGIAAAWIAVAEQTVNQALATPLSDRELQSVWLLPATECLAAFRQWLDCPPLQPAIEILQAAANTPRPENTGRGRGRLALRPGGLWRRGRG